MKRGRKTAVLGWGRAPVVDGPTSIERELSRGEALRELSRAQRQLLAALAALESDDRREREAAALALDHAETRVAHAMAALDRLADGPPDDDAEPSPTAGAPGSEPEPRPGASSPRGSLAAIPLFEGSSPDPQRAAGRPGTVGAASFGDEAISQYLAELGVLARQCATDVADVRALLQAAGDLEVGEHGEAAAPDADVAPPAAVERGEISRASRRREVLRQLAAELGATAVDDLARSVSDLDRRLQAVARAVPSADRHARIDALERLFDTRLSAVEERLSAIERRIRWLEDALRAGQLD